MCIDQDLIAAAVVQIFTTKQAVSFRNGRYKVPLSPDTDKPSLSPKQNNAYGPVNFGLDSSAN